MSEVPLYATNRVSWRENLQHTRQSRPVSGLDLSHFQYERLDIHLICSESGMSKQRIEECAARSDKKASKDRTSLF